MAKTETVKATELKVGDEIHFPNSRHAQAITEIPEHDMSETHVKLKAAETEWTVPNDWDVKRKVSEDAGE